MIEKEFVIGIIDKQLEDSDLFLVDLRIGKDNKISVFIDGDNGVKIQDCINVSRAIEGNLDREVEDFALSVYSAGVGEPLMQKRQYIKNIGRNISITTNEDEHFEGELMMADDEKIVVKQKRKKKKDFVAEKEIEYGNIKEGKIIILF